MAYCCLLKYKIHVAIPSVRRSACEFFLGAAVQQNSKVMRTRQLQAHGLPSMPWAQIQARLDTCAWRDYEVPSTQACRHGWQASSNPREKSLPDTSCCPEQPHGNHAQELFMAVAERRWGSASPDMFSWVSVCACSQTMSAAAVGKANKLRFHGGVS